MDLSGILAEARGIWGPRRNNLQTITNLLGVVSGDLCRQARAQAEGRTVDKVSLKKELGNLIVSTVRWCDDLGFDVEDCVKVALGAQRAYAAKLTKEGRDKSS